MKNKKKKDVNQDKHKTEERNCHEVVNVLSINTVVSNNKMTLSQ